MLGLVLLVGAAACGIASALTWRDVLLEGAYLNRSIGAPAYAGTFTYEDNAPAQILLGAAIGLAVAAIGVIALEVRRSRSTPSV